MKGNKPKDTSITPLWVVRACLDSAREAAGGSVVFVDPCTIAENPQGADFYRFLRDGSPVWSPSEPEYSADYFAWINPPFSNVQVGLDEAMLVNQAGGLWALLTLSDTSTRYARTAYKAATHLTIITCRLQFFQPFSTSKRKNGFNRANVIWSNFRIGGDDRLTCRALAEQEAK